MSRLLVAVAIAGLVAGCGDFASDLECAEGPCAPTGVDSGGRSPDAGVASDPDGGPSMGPPLDPSMGIRADGTEFTAGGARAENGDTASCYDGEGAGGLDDALSDCDDPSCGGLASCCVGTGSELCCVDLGAESPLPSALAFDETCTGDPATSCLAGEPVVSFGMPSPWVRSNRLHPGGDASYDSGLVVGGELDLTAMRVSVSTTIGLPTDPCTADCLEGAGIALTAQETFGASTLVQPLAALFASGARREVVLLVGDVVVHRWADVEPDATWTLTARPTGDLDVTYEGETVTEPFPTSDRARLVLYGRNRNQSAIPGTGASLGSVSTAVSVCDMPTAWRDRSGLLIRPSGTGAPIDSTTLRGASIAWDIASSREILAYRDGGDFYLAQRGGDEVTFIQLRSGEAVLQRDKFYEEAAIADPELVITDAGRVLFYTATATDGRTTIGRATEHPTTEWAFVSDEVPFVSATGIDLSMPSVVHHPTMPNVFVMAVRADLADGSHAIRLYVSVDGGVSFESFADRSDLGELTSRGAGMTRVGFDADEIAAPSLVIHRGAYHLYYAGRSGTRWSIGMLSSDELVFWRDPNAGAPVLTADGNGGDRLSVGDPEANPRGSVMELLYTGNDGARDALFRAWRLSREEPTP